MSRATTPRSCSTIYLDKPMRNHTLMQTIARANRVFGDKTAGLIVDYIGIFRDLERALAIYGAGPGGGEKPIQPKSELVAALRQAVVEAEAFCSALGIDLDALIEAEGFEFIKVRDDAVDAVLRDDETRKAFFQHANFIDRIFKAILPDPSANEFAPRRAILVNIRDKIRSLDPTPDISVVMDQVEDLLNESVAAYRIRAQEQPEPPIDLSRVDFEALKKRFDQGRKRTEAEKLKAAINSKLTQMVRLNPTRIDYLEKLRELIDQYNSGAVTPEIFFQKLVAFAKELNEEDKRGIAEGLSDEELTVFDLLTKPEIELTKAERDQVKEVAHELLQTLKQEKLVLDWRKRQQSRAEVRLAIEETLDRLPAAYDKQLFATKCERVYQHVYDSYYGEGQSVYTRAA